MNLIMDLFQPGGKFFVEHYRPKKNGKLRKIDEYLFPNGITNVGKNYILNVGFDTGSQIAQTSWFIGLIDNTSFTALNATDTMASHSGWIEFTSITQTTRPLWGNGSSTAQSLTNASPVAFNITAAGNINGIFINSDHTLSGTTGTLWSTGSFGSVVPVAINDQLNTTYTLSC